MFRSYTDCVRTVQDDAPSSSNQCNSAGYACDMCPKGSAMFIAETDVEIHRKKNHYQEIVKLRAQYKERFCTVCMKIQPNYSSLISHIKTEHLLSSPMAKRVEREIYICDHCDNIFFNKEILEIHVQFKHLYNMSERRNRYFKCPCCVKMPSLINVWFHFQRHDITSSMSVCDICSLAFQNREQLHEHLKSHPFLYRCEICLYTTTKESLFNSHLNQHESRVIKRIRKVDKSVKKIFRMTRKEFTNYNIHNLLKGLNLPNTLRICILCREICTDKVDMRVHVLRDHLFKETAVKVKYVCACGEEFYNKILIKQHVFKLKEMHRILGEDELPEPFNIGLEEEKSPENTLDSNYEDLKPVFVIKTLDGAYQTIDENEPKINTDNHTIPTNKEAENTDVIVKELRDGQTENNIIINTEKLADSGVIVITRVINDETGMDDQIMSTDSQVMDVRSQIMITDSQKMITDSQTITNDALKMITDSQMSTDSQKMITDSQTITNDTLKMITDSQMTTGSQKMITDSQTTDSHTTDSHKMITDSQILTTDSQKMITDSQNDY